ncbi:MAG: C39 family peptidase [Patescibacteria group bacterium]
MLLFSLALLLVGTGTSTPIVNYSQQPAIQVTVPDVPFYSQFADITSAKWQKVGCGVASLAMVVDYYKPAVSVDTLLKEGIASGAYLKNAGWTYKGLIQLSTKYGLAGDSYDLGKLSTKVAFAKFIAQLEDGPVIASVHYKFDPKSTIPHLVVIDGIKDGVLYYNDPAAKTGQKQISTADFLKAWKKRFIVIRPAETTKSTLSFLPVSTPQLLSL